MALSSSVTSIPMRTIILLLCLTLTAHAKQMRCTGYTGAEDRRYHDRDCTGQQLDESKCAADLSIYPLGTRMLITSQDGDSSTRTVSDCGSAVKGSGHIDLYFNSRSRMNEWGTQICDVQILGNEKETFLRKSFNHNGSIVQNTSANWRTARQNVHLAQSSKLCRDGHAMKEKEEIADENRNRKEGNLGEET